MTNPFNPDQRSTAVADVRPHQSADPGKPKVGAAEISLRKHRGDKIRGLE
jgi:hypothetical protein